MLPKHYPVKGAKVSYTVHRHSAGKVEQNSLFAESLPLASRDCLQRTTGVEKYQSSSAWLDDDFNCGSKGPSFGSFGSQCDSKLVNYGSQLSDETLEGVWAVGAKTPLQPLQPAVVKSTECWQSIPKTASKWSAFVSDALQDSSDRVSFENMPGLVGVDHLYPLGPNSGAELQAYKSESLTEVSPAVNSGGLEKPSYSYELFVQSNAKVPSHEPCINGALRKQPSSLHRQFLPPFAVRVEGSALEKSNVSCMRATN